MSIKLIKFNGETQVLNEICEHLKNLQPIIIPTDTQWGICAINPSIVNNVKQRDKKEVIQLVDAHYYDYFAIDKNDSLKSLHKKFIEQFWPGQVTIIHHNKSYRRTNAKYLNMIIDNLSLPCYCSSANITNNPPIQTPNEALTLFNSTKFDILLVVTPDYEKTSSQIASTIINFDHFKIIRRGNKIAEVEKFISTYVNNQ